MQNVARLGDLVKAMIRYGDSAAAYLKTEMICEAPIVNVEVMADTASASMGGAIPLPDDEF